MNRKIMIAFSVLKIRFSALLALLSWNVLEVMSYRFQIIFIRSYDKNNIEISSSGAGTQNF